MENELIMYRLLIPVLMAVVGFFFVKIMKAIEDNTKALNGLNTTVALLKNDQLNLLSSNSDDHKIINERLNAHSNKIQDNAEDIYEMKTDIQLLKHR